MAKFEALNDEEVLAVTGGVAVRDTDNIPRWQKPHWQPENYPMGTTFEAYGYLWYRIKPGDILGRIARTYNTTVAKLQELNSVTIQDVNKILYGDAIIIRKL